MSDYISLNNLRVYKLSRKVSKLSWPIYSKMSWKQQNVIGNQFIRSVDSVGANIAEGYGRYHYKDKVRFFYNARGSLFESLHWLQLLLQRDIINKETYETINSLANVLSPSLNKFIKSILKTKTD